MALRDEIADVVTDATDERHNRTVLGDYDPIDEDGYVERIIALLREAMTSPEARAAVERAVSDQRRNAARYPPSQPTPYQVGVVAVNAALDAITGTVRE